ncbi:MAG: hypothetical protein LC798_06910 [Chloroflexi bacterium]|nr:hypothetical protein [Chloroflexota bacterium]
MHRTLAIAAALALVLAACSGRAQEASPSSADPAPLLSYELTDVRSGEPFTLGELSADRPVLLETMAIWCTTCLSQQRQVVQAHDMTEFHSVGIDVDPNEDADDLAEYAEREGFDWRFVMADAELVQLLTDRYGFGVTNPPSTPTFIVAEGQIRGPGVRPRPERRGAGRGAGSRVGAEPWRSISEHCWPEWAPPSRPASCRCTRHSWHI